VEPYLTSDGAAKGASDGNHDRDGTDLTSEPLGHDRAGAPVTLADLWPAPGEVDDLLGASLDPGLFTTGDADLFDGGTRAAPLSDVLGARALVVPGDSVTTNDISPSGAVAAGSDAGRHLASLGVAPEDFNSYGTRRGNHDVIVRATFANPRLRNDGTFRDVRLTCRADTSEEVLRLLHGGILPLVWRELAARRLEAVPA
jgi:aconitase A